jgi:hypothetical protein
VFPQSVILDFSDLIFLQLVSRTDHDGDGVWDGLPGDFALTDCDVDGSELAALIANSGLIDITTFVQNFGESGYP